MRLRWLILALIPQVLSACDPYLQDPWKGKIELTYKNWSTDHFWNKTGSRINAHNNFVKNEFEVYGELGITRCDTLTVKESWARAHESMNGRTFGFSDMELGWKHFLFCKGPYYVSCRALAIIPICPEFEAAIRYGKFGGELDLLWGWKNCDFLIGYRGYEGFPSDQVRAHARTYCDVCSWIRLKGEAKLDYGVFNGKNRKDASLFCFQPNYRLLELKIEAQVKMCQFVTSNIGYFQNVWGENVGTGGGFYGGLEIHF